MNIPEMTDEKISQIAVEAIECPGPWSDSIKHAITLTLAARDAQYAAKMAGQEPVADMFWDAEDGESHADSIDELLSYKGLSVGETMKIDRAMRLPMVTVCAIPDPDHPDEITHAVVGTETCPAPTNPAAQERPLSDVECWELGKPDSVDRARTQERAEPVAPAVVAGWKLVPVEPTTEMLKAGVTAFQHSYSEADILSDWRECFKAMLAATPPMEEQVEVPARLPPIHATTVQYSKGGPCQEVDLQKMIDAAYAAGRIAGLATPPAPAVQHQSDCSTNNRGVPELLGPCDCSHQTRSAFEDFANRRYAPKGYQPERDGDGYKEDAWQLAWEAWSEASREMDDMRRAYELLFKENGKLRSEKVALLNASDFDAQTAPEAYLQQEIRALSATPPAPAQPIDMLLYCPNCGVQHVDAPESNDQLLARSDPPAAWAMPPWVNPPHRSHLCHACGCIWRPADVPTNGVEAIKTEGKADTWPVPHNEEVIAAIAQPSPNPSKPKQAEAPQGCKLGCTEACKAKEHGCASECPALPWQPTATLPPASAAGEREPYIDMRANRVTVVLDNEVVGSFAGPKCMEHAALFRAALATKPQAEQEAAELVWQNVFEVALKETWEMVNPLAPAGSPGSYARGEYNGIVAALKTVRDNHARALRAARASNSGGV